MNLRNLFRWLYNKIYTYNVFIPDEDDYDDDQLEEPATVLKHQRYATRLYILLLIGFLYILFYTTLMRPQSQMNVISSINLKIFEQLYREHNQTLSCPCSNTTTSFRDFVSNNNTFHSVCNSLFVTEQWIQAFYSSHTGDYLIANFTKTAHAQFQLLSDLCSFAKQSISQNQLDLDNNELVTLDLLHRSQIQSEIDATIDIFENILASRINIFLNYLRTATRANYLVSALNTNFLVQIHNIVAGMMTGGIVTYGQWSQPGIDKSSYIPCSTGNPTSAVGLYRSLNETQFVYHLWWEVPNHDFPLINGFYAGCTPFESLLPSTLDCLYDSVCLQLLSNHFPLIKQMNLNSTSFVILNSEKSNESINHLLLNLFVQSRTTNIDYEKYFQRCSPSFCTYSTSDQTDFSRAITLFISLYGGLIIILRLIAPLLIKISLKVKCRVPNTNANSVLQNTQYMSRLLKWMKHLNLFKKSNNRLDEDIKQQRIITRVYLILLIVAMVILLLFNALSTQMIIISVSNPSLDTYNHLQISHSETLRCPCTNTNVLYQKFISLSPILHQICSSDFVTERWLAILRQSTTFDMDFDWRNRASQQFQLLSNLCQFANQTVNDAIRRFLVGSFITSSILTETDFEQQINAILNEFFQTTTIYFDIFIKTTRLLLQVDQPFMGSIYKDESAIDYNMVLTVITEETKTVRLIFNSYGTRDLNTTRINCICAINPHCQSSTAIYVFGMRYEPDYLLYIDYIPSGFQIGCSPLESLFLSTLECLYSTSDCFPILMNYIREIYFYNVEYPLWFEGRPLIFNSTLSQFLPNESISNIINKIMIERWDSTISYEQFYKSCAPNHCTYSDKIHTKTTFEIVVTLVSMIGGLTVGLRLITPPLVKFLTISLIKHNRRKQKQPKVRVKLFDRVKMIMRKMTGLFYTTAIELNMFPARHFGNNVNRTTAKRLGQWTTRLFILLLIVTSTIITLYSIVQPRALTKTFEKPSFNFYNYLKQRYGNSLKCSCSSVASVYDQFINIEPRFHEICSSEFVSDDWRNDLTIGLVAHFSIYKQRDYRRFLSAHLVFLQGLCELSIQSVNSSIEQFLSSLFITSQLLSEKEFDDRVSSLINQTKSNVPITLNRLLSLTRIVNHRNAIVSTYGTNYEYIRHNSTDYAVTQGIIYDDNCSCELSSNCTTQANFIDDSLSRLIPIKGMKMGCTPSESFRLSTLECFYDQTCLSHIEHYLDYSKSIIPLSRTMKRFEVNSTVNELIKDIFVEEWEISMNYSVYYHQCLPLLCSYTYIERVNILYTITYLLGLVGGMSIVLKWICPQVTRLVFNVYEYRKRRITPVQSLSTVKTSFEERQEDTVALSTQYSSKWIITCIVIIIGITIVIIFSIFIARHERKQQISTALSTVTTSSTTVYLTTTTTISTTTSLVPLCQPTFQLISTNLSDHDTYMDCLVVGDFNSDNQLDLICYSYLDDDIFGLMGLGDGNFEDKYTLTSIDGFRVDVMDSGDFNGDNRMDLVIAGSEQASILLGNGDGTFEAPVNFHDVFSYVVNDISVSDLNNDNRLDIIVLGVYDDYVAVFLGNGDGTFNESLPLYTGVYSYPLSSIVDDFNNDNHVDIAIVNYYARNIGVFLGHNNGSFEAQIESFTGGGLDPENIAVGDFNSDGYLDVVVSYAARYSVGIMFGYGNGSFGNIMKFYTEAYDTRTPIVVIDFNGDGNLDIVFYSGYPLTADILLGDGKGHFQRRSMFLNEYWYQSTYLLVNDFNGDGYQDIISMIIDYPYSWIYILLNTCGCCTSQ